MNAQDTSAEPKPDLPLEIAHILLIDVVGYSKLLVNEQIELLQELNQIVRDTECFRAAETKGKLIRVSTGDGMALVFSTSPEEPVRCAVEISRTLQGHPHIQLRMGVHSGPVNQVTDVNDKTNIAGAGINVAQRVMDCGDAGHILLSGHIAEDLTQYRHWQPYLHDLGECEVKHGLRLHLVNLYQDNLGNPHLPDKLKRRRRWKQTSGVSVRPVITPCWPKYVLTAVLLVSAVALAISFSVFYRRGSPAVARSSAGKAAAGGVPIAEKSIAVLPFENRSEDKANAYFAEGVQDEILTRLSKIADLKVTSRTSTQHYKSVPENLAEIAKQLGVAHILEGSVQKSGDAVRVNVQLIKADNDSQVWAETFDRKLTDIFSVESDVAKAIADQLRANITRQEEQVIAAKPTKNIEAYDAYLRGRYFWNKRTSDGIKHAIEHFQQSIARDPDFALGHAGLADSYIALTFYNFAAPHETMPKAKESAIKALALDDPLAEAHASLAHILMNYDWNWAAAEKEFKRSIELKPDYATAHEWYAIHYLTATGRFEEAVQEMKRALELEPASLVMNTFMGATLYYAGRYDEAIDQCRRTIEMDPNFAVAHWHLGLAYEQKQALDAATEEFKKAISLSGGSPLMKAALVRAYAKSQKTHEANEMLNELNELAKRQYASAYEIAAIYVELGNNEEAFQLLEKAYSEHSFHLANLNVCPQFKSVRSDPRFQDLVQRVGLSR